MPVIGAVALSPPMLTAGGALSSREGLEEVWPEYRRAPYLPALLRRSDSQPAPASPEPAAMSWGKPSTTDGQPHSSFSMAPATACCPFSPSPASSTLQI